MEIANNKSWYANPNTGQFTSNPKNAAINDREAFKLADKYSDTVPEKVAQDKAADYDEKAFNMVAPNAPQNVKAAWLEAAKEVNANGLGIQKNGMMTHISQMMVQRLNKMFKGEVDNFDILGNSVESAMQATKQALYDLEHPREYTPKSIAVQQARMKEQEFYKAFIGKLEQL